MLPADWCRVIDEVAQLGGRMVQFIGGEPTLYQGLPDLVHRALGQGLEVEVFSNLVRVSSELWETFTQRGVRLATSYYTDHAAEHEAVTKGRGSHARTKANITEALRWSIPLRVGLVDVQDGQRVEHARAELEALGVTEIGTDHLRQVGRGIRQRQPSIDPLCGHCARGKVAVSPNGDVWPCVFARWMPVGNVRQRTLIQILTGPEMATATATLADHLPVPEMPCVPRMCDPQCGGPNCGPAYTRPSGRTARGRAARRTGVCRTMAPAALMTTKTTRSLVFVRRAYIPDALQPKDYRAWPFTVPCVAELAAHGLEFSRPVTFLVGDNGSGKSTLVEAIAEGFHLDSHGGRGRPRPAARARRRPRSVHCCDWRPPRRARGC